MTVTSEENPANVKVIVAYHKKDILYKNEILIPLHSGRAVAYDKSKDGVISVDDYNWLINNLLGDDSGDNISVANRALNEMTAIYWAWKNYDKLGNPDYIGLNHYRRLFNITGDEVNKADILHSLGLDNKNNIVNLFDEYDILARLLDFSTVNSTVQTIEDYVNAVDLKNKHIGMYNAFLRFKEKKLYYAANLFLMRREDFFDYCETIFNLLLPVYNSFFKNCDNRINTRFLGCCSEFLTGFYIDYLQYAKGYRIKNLDIYTPVSEKECRQKFIRTLINNIFSVRNELIKNKKYKVITILGLKYKKQLTI